MIGRLKGLRKLNGLKVPIKGSNDLRINRMNGFHEMNGILYD